MYAIWRSHFVNIDSLTATQLKTLSGSPGLWRVISQIYAHQMQTMTFISLVYMLILWLPKLHRRNSLISTSFACGGASEIWGKCYAYASVFPGFTPELSIDKYISLETLLSLWALMLFLIGGCSSLGQGLLTSTYVGEIMVAIVVATLGLVLFALLIGNMQVIRVWICQIEF